jgi:hypothetical protein
MPIRTTKLPDDRSWKTFDWIITRKTQWSPVAGDRVQFISRCPAPKLQYQGATEGRRKSCVIDTQPGNANRPTDGVIDESGGNGMPSKVQLLAGLEALRFIRCDYGFG